MAPNAAKLVIHNLQKIAVILVYYLPWSDLWLSQKVACFFFESPCIYIHIFVYIWHCRQLHFHQVSSWLDLSCVVHDNHETAFWTGEQSKHTTAVILAVLLKPWNVWATKSAFWQFQPCITDKIAHSKFNSVLADQTVRTDPINFRWLRYETCLFKTTFGESVAVIKYYMHKKFL